MSKLKKDRVTEWVPQKVPLHPKRTPKMFPVNISPPGGLERCVRGQNRSNWTLRVQKRCFWVISTPSRGQKWQKTHFFCDFLKKKSTMKFFNWVMKTKNVSFWYKNILCFYTKKIFFKKFSRRPQGAIFFQQIELFSTKNIFGMNILPQFRYYHTLEIMMFLETKKVSDALKSQIKSFHC